MSATVTKRQSHQPPPMSAERRARYAAAGRCLTDRFAACQVGGMLLLKLAGFIEDERAEILEVSDAHIILQLGKPWFARLGRGADRRRPVEVRIEFAELGDDLGQWQKANARRSMVNVQIRPLSSSYKTDDFHRRADAILSMLRLHFVAD